MKKPSWIRLILLCFCVLLLSTQGALAAKKRKPVEITVESYDKFKVVGTLDIPNYASLKVKAPLIVFLHSICNDHHTWENFPTEIKDNLNVATLNLDLRGHGKSIWDKDNKKVHWQNLTKADYQKMPEDVIEVLKYLKNNYPEINHKKIAIIGSSLGACVGAMTASYGESIETLVLFSPMMKYKGFDLRLPIVRYGKKPMLFIVSKKDGFPYRSSKELIKYCQGEKELKVYPYGGHGESLLEFQPDSKSVIMEWLANHFTKGTIQVKTETIEEKMSNYDEKKVGEYEGKIKNDRNIYRGIH